MKKSKAQIEYEKKFNKIVQKLHGNQPQTQQKTTKGLTNQQKVSKAQRDGVKYQVVQKGTTNKKSQVSNVGKLLNEDVEIKEVPKEIAKQVQQARNEHKLTQDQLAKKVLKNVISTCKKYTDNTGGGYNQAAGLTNTSNNIWLLSEYENTNQVDWCNEHEGDVQERYAYRKNGNNFSFTIGWYRSPYVCHTSLTTVGERNLMERGFACSTNPANANTSKAVNPCFCIG